MWRLQILGGAGGGGGGKIVQKEIEKLEKFIGSSNEDEKFVEYNEDSFTSSSQFQMRQQAIWSEQLEISDRERKMHKRSIDRHLSLVIWLISNPLWMELDFVSLGKTEKGWLVSIRPLIIDSWYGTFTFP